MVEVNATLTNFFLAVSKQAPSNSQNSLVSRALVSLASKWPCWGYDEVERQNGVCYECPSDGDALRGFVEAEPEGGLEGHPVVRIECLEQGYEGSI